MKITYTETKPEENIKVSLEKERDKIIIEIASRKVKDENME